MRKGRNYDVYESEGPRAASKREWAAWVTAGKKARISQAVGVFGSDNEPLEVYTIRFRMSGRPPGEWVSRAIDRWAIDLITPLYCPPRSTPEEIEAMHAQALSKARAFLGSYVERPIHYSENILGEEGSDPRYLAKAYDFKVDKSEEEEEEEDPQCPPFEDWPEKARRRLVLWKVIAIINSKDLSMEDRVMIIADALDHEVSRERRGRPGIHNISVPRVLKEFQRIWHSKNWPRC